GVSPWQLLGGSVEGCTQVDATGGSGVDAVWDHPIDVHLGVSTPVGWPRLRVEVWSRDAGGTNVLAGYGFCNVPSSPGAHSVDIVTWVPSGSLNERLSGFFLGTKPQLEDPGIVSNTAPGEGRFGLKCESSGIVYVHFEVLLTNMQRFGVLT
ncbi:hypothetical protein TeGR_g8404, partial [Tetraparma gracilis]